jgi:hypothetical protein
MEWHSYQSSDTTRKADEENDGELYKFAPQLTLAGHVAEFKTLFLNPRTLQTQFKGTLVDVLRLLEG